jgi:thiol:disulfide interchange protein
VIVATPCSAPFMGAALGYALAQASPVALAVFTFLGLGLALPYVVLSWFPALLRKLPRPGRWMESLKQFLAFPMFATSVWLMWVIGQQSGINGVVSVAAGMLALGMAAWAGSRWRGRAIARLVVILLLALAALAVRAAGNGVAPQPASEPGVSAAGPKSGSSIAWEKFTPARLQGLRSANKPVFIDFTAAWCVSCKVNERLVFGDSRIIAKFAELGIVPLKADWTNRDPEITRILEQHGRSGVPLYLWFPAGARSAEVLPEIITPGLVLERLSGGKR